MDKLPHTKHIKRIDEDLDLDPALVDLMHFVPKLTIDQAKETLRLFQKLEYAIPVAEYFFDYNQRKTYANYNVYLETVYNAMNPKESVFDEEVAERTCGLQEKITDNAFSTGYRNRPSDSKHFREHLATQDLSPEFDEGLYREYIKRRLRDGL